jgi:hypothetical protein
VIFTIFQEYYSGNPEDNCVLTGKSDSAAVFCFSAESAGLLVREFNFLMSFSQTGIPAGILFDRVALIYIQFLSRSSSRAAILSFHWVKVRSSTILLSAYKFEILFRFQFIKRCL